MRPRKIGAAIRSTGCAGPPISLPICRPSRRAATAIPPNGCCTRRRRTATRAITGANSTSRPTATSAKPRPSATTTRSRCCSAAAAEAIPAPAASFDIVSALYLFHELPGQVRQAVSAEIQRVLKPGGRLILVDSLQTGDEPDYDALLDYFPVAFHEPYYASYLV